ncbi:hypothetical protein Tco_1445255, partial [Tanacetum coccineum]
CINLGELLLLSLKEVYLERHRALTRFVSPEHKSFRMRHSPEETRSGCAPLGIAKEETQIYGVILPESLTSPKIKETKSYKTYFGFATGATPPNKLTILPVSTEEPTGKSKRVKRHAKKSTKAPARGVVIRETHEMPLSKKKEKVDVTRGKGIELLSEVALTGGSYLQLQGNDEDDSNNDQDFRSKGSDQERDSGDDKAQSDSENGSASKHETDENESNSESDQDENEEEIKDDKEEEEEEVVKTTSNDSDDEDETKITDKVEGDEDEEMDYTTSLLYDDVEMDIRLNELVDTDKGFIQEEGTNVEVTNIQQGNKNLEISQFIEDAHVALSTIP